MFKRTPVLPPTAGLKNAVPIPLFVYMGLAYWPAHFELSIGRQVGRERPPQNHSTGPA